MRVIMILVFCFLFPFGVSLRPSVVNIGALLTFNSTIGRVAQAAIAAAAEDVNANSSVLLGTTLNVITVDTNCSGFFGNIEGMSSSFKPYRKMMRHLGLLLIVKK